MTSVQKEIITVFSKDFQKNSRNFNLFRSQKEKLLDFDTFNMFSSMQLDLGLR